MTSTPPEGEGSGGATAAAVAAEQQEKPAAVAAADLHAAATADGTEQQTSPGPQQQEEAKKEEEAHQKEEWEIQRDAHKSSADSAFRSRDYTTAIQQYTHALSLDPTNPILLSNRSAAYLSNGEKSKSLADARECIKVSNGEFTKGYSRLAAAMMSLGRWGEARTAYGKVLERDGGNAAAKKGVEDCRAREVAQNMAEVERLKKIREEKEAAAEEEASRKMAEEEVRKKAEEVEEVKNADGGDDGDDLLDDFFADVETATTKKSQEETNKKEKSESKDDSESKDPKGKPEKKIQIHLSDLGSSSDQIERLLAPNHEWRNLNPYYVLAVPHDVPPELLSRRYKALSLLLHPDKCPDVRAKDAFEYVRRAMKSLTDEDKAKHTRALIEQGMKQGKREYTGSDPAELAKTQERAVMKIFAEIERSRREVERRKRAQEKREREQEDEEVRKTKAEMSFNKKWREENRVEKRIGNWRDFQGGKKQKK